MCACRTGSLRREKSVEFSLPSAVASSEGSPSSDGYHFSPTHHVVPTGLYITSQRGSFYHASSPVQDLSTKNLNRGTASITQDISRQNCHTNEVSSSITQNFETKSRHTNKDTTSVTVDFNATNLHTDKDTGSITMATLRKERSTVRFAQGTATLPKLSHVYAPELHRQVTERVPFSRLGHVLNHFTDVGLGEALDPSATATAKVEIGEILEKSFLSLKRNRVGLDILPPVQVHCFTHWHVQPEARVVCLLPVKFHKAKVIQRDMGHSLIKLPAPSSKSVTPSDEQHQQGLPDVRTKDGLHVSPRKLHVACAKLVQSTLVKHGVPKENVQVSLVASDLSIVVQLPCGWRAELVPCVASPDGGDVFYVAKRYTSEPHERGDVSWRPCFSVTEQELLHSISSTDGGLRVGAMHVLCRLLSRDFRLAHFTCYHVQTALLHDMDFHVDFSPRWQRCTLESCVRSLLSTLLYFVERSSLPHFDLNQLNLWEYMTPRQLTQARGALSRLLTNENALISLLRRASGESSASFDFGLT